MATPIVYLMTEARKKPFWLWTGVHLRHTIPDIIIIVLSWYASLYLRVGQEGMPAFLKTAHIYLPIILAVRMTVFMGMGIYKIIWRYVTAQDAYRLGRAILISTFAIIALSFFIGDLVGTIPRSVYLIDAMLLTLSLMGIRLTKRLTHEHKAGKLNHAGHRTLIYGAGNNGRTLLHRFRSDGALGMHVMGFVDDDPHKQGMNISGIKVLGSRRQLPEIIANYGILELIVAIPDIPGDTLREIVQLAARFKVRVRMISKLASDDIHGRKTFGIYRTIELSDLLNREPRQIDLSSTKDMIAGRRVLITGAGGSIGSELARQILAHEPSRLVVLDHAEYNLYEIDKELKAYPHGQDTVVSLMIDLKDESSLRNALRKYNPEIVFHAAAYKHVHLVEANPYPAVLNNILGTRNLLQICRELGVETFVNVSTDKAVNPVGVMGATKRISEILTTIAAWHTGRRYCSVRFGNVLGSSGSFIPLLRRQIEAGGPVTITHKDMTRFFMLIPEAVSLVLKAASIAKPGDINVLKMGDPVRIVDIAKSMIALMGKSEDEIPLVYTGLRPGEKMFEELYIRGDELRTEHPDILTLPNGDSDVTSTETRVRTVEMKIDHLIDLAQDAKEETVFVLSSMVKNVSMLNNCETDVAPVAERANANVSYIKLPH